MVVGSLTTPQLLFRKEAGSSKQAVEITKTLIKKKQFDHRWRIESYHLVWKNLRKVIQHFLRIVDHYVKSIEQRKIVFRTRPATMENCSAGYK